MAREIYVDCLKRDPTLSLESLRRDVRALRGGASCVVVQTDDPVTLEGVRAFAQRHDLVSHTHESRGIWWVRLYLLPEVFGEVPLCAQLERHAHQLVRPVELGCEDLHAGS